MRALGNVQPTVERLGSAPHIRRDIQGLRALAVVAVIGDHLLGWPAGGFVGVDVFFVISGYIITSLLLREHGRTGRISPSKFYVRRIRRVVPVAAVVLYVTVCLSLAVDGLSERAKDTTTDAVWATFFVANWRFVSEGTDYFEQGQTPSPLQHYWSLGVEEQFYLVWPWMLLLVLTVAARIQFSSGRTSRPASSRVIAGVVIALISAISFYWSLEVTRTDPTVAYFSSLSRAWELGLGALLAMAAPVVTRLTSGPRYFLGYTGLAGIVASLFVIDESSGFPAPWAALPVVATAIVIVSGEGMQVRLWPLTGATANYLGDVSYSLYLWHFPVVVMLGLYVVPGGLAYSLIGLALTLGLSLASFYMLETPIRRSRWLEGAWGCRQVTAWSYEVGLKRVLLPAALTAALVAVAVVQKADVPQPGDDVFAQSNGRPPCLGAAVLAEPRDCVAIDDVGAVYPSPVDLENDSTDSYTCFTRYGVKDFATCDFGRQGSSIRVALVGDSHAAVLIPGLAEAAEQRGWTLSAFVGQGCSWNPASDCPALPGIVEAVNDGKFDAVVTSVYRRNTAGGDAASEAMVDQWRDFTVPLVVVADVPEVTKAAIDCIKVRTVSPDSGCSTSRAVAFAVEDPLVQAAERDGRPLIDLTDLLCPVGDCPAIIGNVLVYRDELSHLSDTYSRTLGSSLGDRLEQALPEAFSR